MNACQMRVVLGSCLMAVLGCAILAMPTTDSTPPPTTDTSVSAHISGTSRTPPDSGAERQKGEQDSDHKDDTYDEDDEEEIYDDEEFLNLLLKDAVSTENSPTQPESTPLGPGHSTDVVSTASEVGANSMTASDGVQQSRSGVADVNEDIINQDREMTTQRQPNVAHESSGDSQSQPRGRDAPVVALQHVHDGLRAQMSATGESVRTSGQLQDVRPEPRGQGLELGAPVVIEGLRGRGHVRGADILIHNGNSSNRYNTDSIDSNIEIPSGGANTSSSSPINVHLSDTQHRQADGVLPVTENYPVKMDELANTSDQPRVDQAVADRHQTANNATQSVISADATNSLGSTAYSLLRPSFSDVIPSSQTDTMSFSHEMTSLDFSLIPTLSQTSSPSDHTQNWPIDHKITSTVSTIAASQSYVRGAAGFHTTPVLSSYAQTTSSQPQTAGYWFIVSAELSGVQANMTHMDVLPTWTTLHSRTQKTIANVRAIDQIEDSLVNIDGGHTHKTTHLDATGSTQTTHDLDLSTIKANLIDHSVTRIPVVSILSSTPLYPTQSLQVSATPAVMIMAATIVMSIHDPPPQDTSSKADYSPKDPILPLSPAKNMAPRPTASQLAPTSADFHPVFASSMSTDPQTGGATSTVTLIVHTQPNPALTLNPADVDRVVIDATVKSAVYPVISENTPSIADVGRETPTLFLELKFKMSWSDFCHNKTKILDKLARLLQAGEDLVVVSSQQIRVMPIELEHCPKVTKPGGSSEILVHVFMVNTTGQPDTQLTLHCAQVLETQLSAGKDTTITSQLVSVRRIYKDNRLESTTGSISIRVLPDQELVNSFSDPGVTIAIVLATVGGCYCLGVVALQIVLRFRNKVISIPQFKHSFSITSSDSIQLTSVNKSRPNSGLFNPGLDLTDQMDPSNPLNLIQLSRMCLDENKIHEEFQRIPQQTARLSVVPAGDEDKNRYANVLPLAHTRVRLIPEGPEPSSSYINANYVTGPNNTSRYYIATQGPTEKTTADFWTMVWQQGCKVIVMLTQLEEEGQVKCASYFPELVGKCSAQQHGHFLVELLQKDVHQEYIYSRLQINNLREIETKEVDHFWYTCWPPLGVPEPISLVKLVLDTRPRYQQEGSPLVVHCSPGTGRTCTFIALDLCMRQFEERRVVDVMTTVYNIRQERAGAVQNKEQYTLLYNAVSEYAMMVVSPVISAASSATTLHALLQS